VPLLLVSRRERKRPALFGDFTQHRIVYPHRRFGATYRPRRQGSISPRGRHCLTLEYFIYGFSRNVVRNLESTIHKVPKELRSHLHEGGCVKSRNSYKIRKGDRENEGRKVLRKLKFLRLLDRLYFLERFYVSQCLILIQGNNSG